jgi:predicted ribosome quality control (RQC) complex YloA/Tae2 family protein
MSMNHREIDAVLTELSLSGEKIQRILQPSYDTLVFELFSRGRQSYLLISVSPSACRIHGLKKEPARNERPLRFMECLRSRIRGGVIEEATQVEDQRIVKLGISVYTDLGIERGRTKYTLYCRLWSGAGNILLVDDNGIIVDALLRKPEKGEFTGQTCKVEEGIVARSRKEYAIRELPGPGNLTERIDRHYANASGEISRENLLKRAQERYERKLMQLNSRQESLESTLREFATRGRLKEIGDILIGMEPAFPTPGSGKTSGFVEAYDFYSSSTVSIKIDPRLSMVENARSYYEKAKKANSGYEDVVAELQKTIKAKDALEQWKALLEEEIDPFAMAKMLERGGTVRKEAKKKYPCLTLDMRGWTILVGRSSKENDDLLRHYVKGSDHWLHARDYAGSYVFIKAKKGKTFPLDVLLDAGMLALYYSKARKDSAGDVYHTDVKYLKRVKDGPKGLVIPTMEKNLRCSLEEGRIKGLLEGSEGDKQ